MMKNITILCNTPYQLIVAVYLNKSFFQEDKVSLLISDAINGSGHLITNLRNSAKFEQVFLVHRQLFRKIENSKWKRALFHEEKKFFARFLLRKCSTELPEICDIFLCANIDLFGVAFCQCFDCQLDLFEDGIASYSMELGEFYQDIFDNHNEIKKKRYACYANAGRIYLFCPERLKWKPPFMIEKMGSFIEDMEFIQFLNQIFEYDSLKEPYAEKYIFFEEAYYSDGRDVDDVGIVSMIADVVGKENILIKRHPRSEVDRFGEIGFHTNSNSGIPWEVIAINVCLDKKVIITIASAAAITPYLLLGMKMKAILLYKLFSDAPLKRDVLEVLEDICGENPDCLTPDSREQLIDILENIRENY